MSTDRETLLAAIRGTRNLGEAARSLGVSRRTLQNRMRAAGLARGRGGRPKRKLAYSKRAKGWSAGIAAAVGLAAGALLWRRGGSGA